MTGRPATVGPVSVAVEDLLAVVVALFSASVLSASRMVSVSPTLRAVTLFHSVTSVPCAKIAPGNGFGASASSGQLGSKSRPPSSCSVAQPPQQREQQREQKDVNEFHITAGC